MRSLVISKNVSWTRLIWPTLYIIKRKVAVAVFSAVIITSA